MRGTALTLVAAVALLAFVSDAAGQSAAPASPPPPDTQTTTVVLSTTDNTQTVQASDLRLLLSKARIQEHALIRRLIFISASLSLTQPANWTGAAPQTCHWAYKSFLQRQQCFVSISGALACTEPEVMVLPEAAEGDSSPPPNAQVGFCSDVFRPAVTDRARLTARLSDQAAALFAADQQTKVEPAFKAAGLIVRPEPVRKAAPPPAGRKP